MDEDERLKRDNAVPALDTAPRLDWNVRHTIPTDIPSMKVLGKID